MPGFRTLCVGAATALAAPLLALAAAAPAQAAGPCDLTAAPDGHVLFKWSGGGGDGKWSTDANWDVYSPAATGGPDLPDRAPNFRPEAAATTDDSSTGLVCVSSTPHLTIDLVFSRVHVQQLEIRGDVTLDTTNAAIMVYGAAPGAVSSFGPDTTLNLHGSYLGGPGRIDFGGHLEWAVLGGGTATLTNDLCWDVVESYNGLVDECASEPPATGQLRVLDQAVVDVNGRGVNLSDGYDVDVLDGGTLKVTDAGYIAADWTTHIGVAPGGTFELTGDGNVFEGKLGSPSESGILAEFVNDGTVVKDAGSTGISSLNVRYSGTGTIDVQSGTLNVANGTTAPSVVGAGATVGTGRCAEAATCVPDTSGTDLQNATVTLDDANAGLSVVEEQVVAPEKDLQPAVSVDAVGDAGDGTLRLTYDRAIVNQVGYTRVEVFRGPSPIPSCAANGDFPNGIVTACVRGRTRLGRSVQIDIRARANGLEGQWRAQARPHFYRATDPIIGGHYSCAVAPSSYPATVRVPIWHRVSGNVSLYRRVTPTSPQSFVKTVVTPAGVSSMPITVTKTGYVRLGEPSGLYSNLYRVVATGSVKYTRLTRKVSRGKVVTIRGTVTPNRLRSYQLYVKGPGGGLLKPLGKVRSTSSTGAFVVRYRTPGDARIGTWRFAIKLAKDDARGLRPAMSFRAVKVYVAPAPVTPVETPPVSTDYRSTSGPSGLPDVSWELRAAATCNYYVP
ncbi:hypothetical protein [Nocardioides aromaticivorans]|uniref:hypothetical protein n=1 Tax=Nocardioides aromaticivorans TaxID=200618 RepID=UPI001A900D53|nr:hypothetical protein [Nocardioides aromaticivorans]